MDEKGDNEMVLSQQKLVNGVGYEYLPETTIAVSRTFKKNFFQKNTYNSSNNEAICDFNSGAEFINPRRSYLLMKVKLAASPVAIAANFGRGGCTNLIKRVVITSRSGVELSRTEEFNLLTAKTFRYGCNSEHVEQFGQVMGYTNNASELGNTNTQLTPTGKVFLIPLTVLSPFFAGDGKTLIPPQLAAGLRVQLTFESDIRALISSATAAAYEIEEIYCMTNVTNMVDSWQKHLSEESARDGLTYSYAEWHTTQTSSPIGTTSANIEVRKAVARAMFAFTVTQTPANAFLTDNMKSDTYGQKVVEYRLGSLYPTQAPISTSEEMYFHSQSAWDADVPDPQKTNSVSLNSFKNSTQTIGASTGVADGDAITSTSLERNDVSINGVLNIGGLPTNNSRVLAVNIVTPSSPAVSITYLFMKHLRIVKAFLDNCSVSE